MPNINLGILLSKGRRGRSASADEADDPGSAEDEKAAAEPSEGGKQGQGLKLDLTPS